MNSQVITVRLRSSEVAKLLRIKDSETRGDLNQSEMIRLLIHREHDRRFERTSQVAPANYQSEHRNGRPREQKELFPIICAKQINGPSGP